MRSNACYAVASIMSCDVPSLGFLRCERAAHGISSLRCTAVIWPVQQLAATICWHLWEAACWQLASEKQAAALQMSC
jgi:hypothetical protein